ncbi:hypothetical protein CEP54_001021 [Fusarium duplospermum]|uniref:O-methyltransferase C-terminal domain-containing protein n=1 Tax=Fusarium duplospermum TaxID=1325734 RepID=A0A428R347_9HYPO|nr:hypothetical protein CEP54_001021 [Fusarium duplospermum]
MDLKDIAPLSREIVKEADLLEELLFKNGKDESPEALLWNHPPRGSDIEKSQSKLLGLIQKLSRTLRGPQDFLHEFVASNWDKGALYCLLECRVLDEIPLDGQATLAQLSEKTGIPRDKLLPMLRLAACDQILLEPSEHIFRHGIISRELVQDPGLKAFIGFQLFETRVASTHLANSLKKPNPTWTGHSAFKHAFAAAMQSVADFMDPGNQLLETWFSENLEKATCPRTVVDLVRTPETASRFLTEKFPSLELEVQQLPKDISQFTLEDEPEAPRVYIFKSILWNLPDRECICILSNLLVATRRSKNSVILVNDLLSPSPGTFEPHVDKAYRRRDVTVMAMHNAKLRTKEEWDSIFRKCHPGITDPRQSKYDTLRIGVTKGYTSHSCRAQWELKLTGRLVPDGR